MLHLKDELVSIYNELKSKNDNFPLILSDYLKASGINPTFAVRGAGKKVLIGFGRNKVVSL